MLSSYDHDYETNFTQRMLLFEKTEPERRKLDDAKHQMASNFSFF